MNRLLKWLLIIEVICVALPLIVLLYFGFLRSFVNITRMLFTLSIDYSYLKILFLTFSGTLWIVGIMKLTIMAVYGRDEVLVENHGRTLIYIAAGCIPCVFILPNSDFGTPRSLYLVSLVLVSFHLLWLNRKELRNES